MRTLEFVNRTLERMIPQRPTTGPGHWLRWALAGKPYPRNVPYRRGGTPDKNGWYVRHPGPNRHERRRIAKILRGARP
jgi:hypothetical protein